MLGRIEAPIYAHSLINPPSFSNSCDATLILVNTKNQIFLEKQEVNLQTKYSLIIPNPLEIGLSSSEQGDINVFIQNLVTAINLNLRKTALMFLGINADTPNIEFHPKGSDIKMEQSSEGTSVTKVVRDNIYLRDDVHVTMKIFEEINEDNILSIFGLINKLFTSEKLGELERNNLTKSLEAYNHAISAPYRVVIFKSLFNSLELAINWDKNRKNELKGEEFDKEVAIVTNLNMSDVEKWRAIYNRTKHVDRELKELTEYAEGIQKIPSFLEKLRTATNFVIIDRLNKIP